ncbi:MAG TPA: tryptophan synthase subunit alpha [Anaerolineae bacterium]|nr:tryptophan synthase subunit alpha [Anaerolineae bacterium]
MQRIAERIQQVLDKNEKVLIGLIPFGDPDLATSRKLVDLYLDSGVDIVELAMASTNPFVDSKDIFESNQRALNAQPDLQKHLDTIRKIRGDYPNEPLEVMAYSDTLKTIGLKRFVEGLVSANIDAHLLADAIFVNSQLVETLDTILFNEKIYRIRFMPHPFREELLTDIRENAKGFLILQSIANQKGQRPRVNPNNEQLVWRIHRSNTHAAVILAYGIRDGERTQEAVQTGCEGIIVGTAFVRKIANDDLQGLAELIREIKEATAL